MWTVRQVTASTMFYFGDVTWKKNKSIPKIVRKRKIVGL